ncbi:hypothetical protein [Sinorhizobium meliloti]|uniref:hypothetical protein n=1 Tax=Rhizobium meliloti TaxID=382 RepID=UPI000FDBEA1B|nr:hypothetical protein [Sinorhizobium meliloti]RVO60619.1 hypothetical protein CN092_04630 [Sinorhizobium meliloti]
MSSPLILDFACPSNEEFERAIDGFSEDAKEGYRRERKRVLRERREAAIAEEKRAVQHGRPITQGAQPPPKTGAKKQVLHEDDFVEAIARVLGEGEKEIQNRLEKEMRAALDDIREDQSRALAQLRKVKNEHREMLEHAVKEHVRRELVRLQTDLEDARREIEQLRQQLNGARLYEVGGAK